METITQAFVQLWWKLQSADEQTLIIGLTTLVSAYAIAWGIQHRKRTKHDNLELTTDVKKKILWSLARLGALFSLADYVLLMNLNQSVDFNSYFFGNWGAIVATATILHRMHVSKAYTKLHGALTAYSEAVADVRAKKAVPATIVTPDAKPFE